MTFHNPALAPIELKSEAAEGDDVVTKALADLTETVDGRLKAIEAKSADTSKFQQRLDEIERRLNRPGSTEHKGSGEEAGKLERKAFEGYIRRGSEALSADEVKSLRISDNTGGGYTAPDAFVAEVLKDIVIFSPIRQAARVGSTGSSSVILPKRTGRPTATWVDETETRSSTGSSYGQAEIIVQEMACYVDVSLRLLEDSAVDIESEVAFDIGEEFGRLEGSSFVAGTGVKQPAGILSESSVATVKTGDAATIGTPQQAVACLNKTIFGLNQAYRAGSSWIMNGQTLASLMSMTNSFGQPLWQPSLQAGQPSMLLGYPVIEAPTCQISRPVPPRSPSATSTLPIASTTASGSRSCAIPTLRRRMGSSVSMLESASALKS